MVKEAVLCSHSKYFRRNIDRLADNIATHSWNIFIELVKPFKNKVFKLSHV